MSISIRHLLASGALIALVACQKDITGPARFGALTPGTAILISGNMGSERVFTIEVPEGTGTLRVRMTGGAGDADIFVRHGARPDAVSYDCSSGNVFSEEECIFDLPSAGTWYVLVYGYDAYSSASLRASLLSQSGATPISHNVPVISLSGAAESFQMFAITVPANTDSLKVSLTAVGDVDLYLRRGLLPLLHQYDCASYTETGSENCLVVSPVAGTWFVRVDGWAAYTDGTLTATLFAAAPPP